ncbi:MAG: GPW/gp25 family protein [Bacteroidales bacterium]|nr:GPW/gp25 family protein [Bacteroidales bacterium]
MIFYSDLNQQDNLVDSKLYDLESIYQSIHNIINTNKGERLFLLDFGVDLEQYLFEPMTFKTVNLVYYEVWNALTKWEPRIKLLNAESGYVPNYDNHTIDLTIAFSIKGKMADVYVYQTTLVSKQKEEYYEF